MLGTSISLGLCGQVTKGSASQGRKKKKKKKTVTVTEAKAREGIGKTWNLLG